jgi:TonB family protein
MRALPRVLPLVLGFLLACWTVPGFGQQEKAPSPPADPLAASLTRGFQLLAEGRFPEARTELERAQTLKGGPCGECLLGLSHVYAADKDWQRAEEAARQATALLKSPQALARAYNQLGMTLVQSRGRGGRAEAEEAFRQAASLGGPWGNLARYNLAEVLLKEERWAEAAEAARGYLKEAGTAGTALREARIVLCQARYQLKDRLPPAETSGLRHVEGEVQPPEILLRVKPQFTPESRLDQTLGTVVVEAIIDQEGCMADVRVLKGLRAGLSESVVKAMRSWVFAPATLQGRPVKVYYVLTVNFKDDNRPSGRP